MKKVKGFAIVVSDGQLGYDGYTYFTTSVDTAENILDEVRDEFPDLRVVPAVIQYDQLPNASGEGREAM